MQTTGTERAKKMLGSRPGPDKVGIFDREPSAYMQTHWDAKSAEAGLCKAKMAA
jgi:hypothetical protein